MSEKDKYIMTWKDGDSSKAIAFNKLYSSLDKATPPYRSFGSDIYKNVDTDLSIRDEFNRGDYEYYRPGEALPFSYKQRIKSADKAYWNHGIIRNIFDLMGDFATQGIDLVHPIKAHQDFYKAWFKTVDGPGRTERFANLLCRMANVIPKRITVKLKSKQVEDYRKTFAAADKQNLPLPIDIEKRELPIQYVFLNPLTLDVVGQELSAFINPDKTLFKLNIPSSLASKIKFPTGPEKDLVSLLPDEIINAVKKGNNYVVLDPTKVSAYYYKKDDWDVWATPMVCSVLKHLNTLDKMYLCDLSALDGAISQIRLWKLGSLADKILPTEAAINKLANILVNAVPGGILDLIWGPELEFKEVTSNLHNFLGEDKYIPILNAIYAGLGIPPLFSGASNQGSFTNNYLAIKTLIERLNYVRSVIIKFWETEVKLVQKAMGFDRPAQIVFDRMTLNDEGTIIQLLLHLVDRGYLSAETVQEMVGATPEVEDIRIARENKAIEKGKKPAKASPFHNPQQDFELKKLFVQQGTLTPSEVGIELDAKAKGERNPLEEKARTAPPPSTSMPKDMTGRPSGVKDKVKRKQKAVRMRTSASKNDYPQVLAWAENAQHKISEIVTPIYLKSINKKNLRQLTTEEFNNFEGFKFALLSSIAPYSDISSNKIVSQIQVGNLTVEPLMKEVLSASLKKYQETNGDLNIDVTRYFQSATYAMFNSEEVDNEIESETDDLDSPIL